MAPIKIPLQAFHIISGKELVLIQGVGNISIVKGYDFSEKQNLDLESTKIYKIGK